MKRLYAVVFPAVLALAVGLWLARGSAGIEDQDSQPPQVAPTVLPTAESENPREAIFISVSLYRLISTGPESAHISQRTDAELRDILDGMNDLWSPAAIRFEPRFIGSVTVPDAILSAVALGNFDPFFAEIGRAVDVPDPGIINGFYARSIGGPNGITPFGVGGRVFLVTDEPSVHDRRVSAHEVGHILGLHHTLESANRLLFPGSNGMELTEEEIVVARYVAQGILDRQR